MSRHASALDVSQEPYDSFESSDEHSDESDRDDELAASPLSVAASPSSVRDAYHTRPIIPSDQPDGWVGGRRFLRRNVNDYQVESNDYTLAPYPRGLTAADMPSKFGLLEQDDREVVGNYLDPETGKAIAHIVEQRPPPANANYCHLLKGNQRRLLAAQGISEHWEGRGPKKEAQHFANGPDNVYGDATLSAARIEEVIASEGKNPFFNRTHEQQFSDQDLSREGYDGYNLEAPNYTRALPLETSWRHLNKKKAPAMRSQALVPQYRVDPEHKTRRKELTDVYRRAPHRFSAIEQISTANLPLASVSALRGNEDIHRPDLATTHAAVVNGGVSVKPRVKERKERLPELSGEPLPGTSQVRASRVASDVDVRPGDREDKQLPPAHNQAHQVAPQSRAEETTRVGSDSVAARRATALTSHPPVSASTLVLTKSHCEREGSDSVRRTRTDASQPVVECTRERDEMREHVGGDVCPAPKPAATQAAQPVGLVPGKQTITRGDIQSVSEERAGSHLTGRRIIGEGDGVETSRSSQETCCYPLRRGSSVVGRRIDSLDPERLPKHETATWRFGQGRSSVASNPVYGVEDTNLPSRALQDAHERDPNIGASQHSAAPHRSAAECTLAQSGKDFGPDRMTEKRPAHWSHHEMPVKAEVQIDCQRSTPIPRMYGAGNPNVDMRPMNGGAISESPRCETPVRVQMADRGLIA